MTKLLLGILAVLILLGHQAAPIRAGAGPNDIWVQLPIVAIIPSGGAFEALTWVSASEEHPVTAVQSYLVHNTEALNALYPGEDFTINELAPEVVITEDWMELENFIDLEDVDIQLAYAAGRTTTGQDLTEDFLLTSYLVYPDTSGGYCVEFGDHEGKRSKVIYGLNEVTGALDGACVLVIVW